jgi:hypothetical protein
MPSETDYYSRHPYYGPGTPANVIQRPGVTSITHLPATVPTHALATGATVISSAAAVESAFAEAAPSAEIESAPSTTEFSSVDRAMERAKVTNADPARFSHIYPITLKYVLEQISKLKLTFQTVGLGETGSELQLTLGTFPDAMEVTLAIFDSHKAAITGMRQTLLCISAPLDVAFAQTIPLGQYSLQGVGGGGYILFVRGNVFVKMAGLTSCEELGMIAGEVDKFLKEKEGGFTSLPKPRIECPEISGRVVKVGEIFEVAVEVADAGWMTAFTDAEIAQLLEMDGENATFKFYATAAGNFDIRLVFAHKDTLQTTTATVHVEVVG